MAAAYLDLLERRDGLTRLSEKTGSWARLQLRFSGDYDLR